MILGSPCTKDRLGGWVLGVRLGKSLAVLWASAVSSILVSASIVECVFHGPRSRVILGFQPFDSAMRCTAYLLSFTQKCCSEGLRGSDDMVDELV